MSDTLQTGAMQGERVSLTGTGAGKPRVLEGTLYVLMSALPPAVTVLQSAEAITIRSGSALAISMVIAGATALKAFMSKGTQ